jgi:predicted RNA-binding protein with PUA-like domain
MAKRSPRQFWLFKTEPESFSIDDLARAPGKTTFWDGVRNYQARNLLRDTIRVGDGVLIYHSSTEPLAIVGTATVVKAGYPDHTAFDPKDHHFDPKSDADEPTWFMVDLKAVRALPRPLPLPELRQRKDLAKMALLRIGRLSVSPVRPAEWDELMRMAG